MPSRPCHRLVVAIMLCALLGLRAAPNAQGTAAETVEGMRDRIETRNENLERLPIALRGRVVDEQVPIAGAVVRAQGRQTRTDSDGVFILRSLARQNVLAEIERAGHTGRVIGLHLDQPATVSTLDLGELQLGSRGADSTSIAFGGDLSLGRRYLDPTGATGRDEFPRNNPDATIRVDHARSDTRAVLSDLERILAPYDLRSVNLETVVTDDPSEPQDSQRYVFFTLPESAEALAEIGVDYASLGNNHVWDYGTNGVADTTGYLDALGIIHSGSGMNIDEAFEPAVVTGAAGTDFIMHSWVATRPIDEVYAQHATEDRAGGANAADRPRVMGALAAFDRPDAVSVAHVHTGIEYTEQPVEWDPDAMVQTRLGHALDGGADLVVAHHPHVAQGYAFEDDVLVAHSLGNLVFDQDRLDTRYGALLSTVFDGTELRSARVDPIHIADYRPTIGIGEPADLALRTWSMASDRDVVLAPDGNGAQIVRRADAVRTTRSVTVTLEPNADGVAHIDLRSHRFPGESIGAIEGADPAVISLGRDLMLLGGMEDLDLDAIHDEATGWSHGSSTAVCPTEARRGSGALCSFRSPGNEGPASVRFGSRIRVVGDRLNEPHRDLTLLIWEAGVGRGDLAVEATWLVSQGSLDFGTHEIARLSERSGGWMPHWISIPDPGVVESLDPDNPFATVPLNEYPRAVRIAVNHEPPTFSDGYAVLDDAALISWHRPTLLGDRYLTPSPYDFVRVEGIHKATITIEFDSWRAS